MLDGCEVLIDQPITRRGERFLQAMAAAAPMGSVVTASYAGRHRLLMLYGPGSQTRLPVVQMHIKAGGRVAMWDLGYWDRQQSMRLSIDSLHPTPAQIAKAPNGVGRREFELREDADPSGPILLIGLGRKSVWAYGINGPGVWERKKLIDLLRRYPGRHILWRPKGPNAVPLSALQLSPWDQPIEQALRGCSLVVCRHSNVAVDAAVAGVPVECEDGAAMALYAGNVHPTREQRADFLRRLSWFEWSRSEAQAAWQWIERVIA